MNLLNKIKTLSKVQQLAILVGLIVIFIGSAALVWAEKTGKINTFAYTIIAAPSDLTATPSGTTINLAWTDNSNNESTFFIIRVNADQDRQCRWTNDVPATYFERPGVSGTGSRVTYSNTGLIAGTTYCYIVDARIGGELSPYSNEASATVGVPGTPSNLMANSAGATVINLSWQDNASDELNFILERAPGDLSSGYSQIATINPATGTNTSVTYTNAGLTTGASYFYRVKAHGNLGDSPYSNEAGATVGGVSSPSDLTAIVVSNTQINLSWLDNATNETGFVIERKSGYLNTGACVGNENFSQLTTVAAASGSGTTVTYQNTGLTSGTVYCYRVKATGLIDSGYDTASALTSGGTLPAAPSNLQVSGTGNNNVNLTWSDNSNNEVYFELQRAQPNCVSDFWQVGSSIPAGTTNISDTTALPGTSYCYKIRSQNTTGFSAFSNTVTASTSGTTDQSPEVSITNPDFDANVSGTINITATATDDHGLNRVEFYYGAANEQEPSPPILLGPGTNSPAGSTNYTYSWNSQTVANGQGYVYAIAYDNAGHSTNSWTVGITVSNTGTATVNLSLTLEGRTNHSTTGTLKIFQGAAQIGEPINISTDATGHSTFTIPSLAAGPYTFKVKPQNYLTRALTKTFSNPLDLTYTSAFFAGDLDNLDGVNSIDFNILRLAFGPVSPPYPPADIDQNGTVNSIDFSLLRVNYAKVGE